MSSYHFNELPPTVIHGVLMYLLQDIFHEHAVITDYWKAMDIASMCRLWSLNIPQFAYHVIFLQRKIQRVYSERQRRHVRHLTWSSNVRSILCQNKSLIATGLRIVMDDNYTGPLQLINAITVFGLASTPWNRFRRLQFFGKGILRAGTAAGLPDSFIDTENFCHFISMNYASLEELGLHPALSKSSTDDADILELLTGPGSFNFPIAPYYSMLLSTRAERLQYLECYQPTSLFLSSLTLQNVTVLDLDLDRLDLDDNVIRLVLPALEKVKLINIRGEVPFDFTQSQNTGGLRQSNLKALRLGFIAVPDSQQHNLVSLVPPLCLYPNLLELALSQSTGVYHDLYSLFRSASLRILQINEDHRTLGRINTDAIRDIDALHLRTISSDSTDWWNDSAHLITRFYSAESVVRKAVLGTLLPFPTHINWVNLVYLSLSTDVATVSNIVRLMEQLPLLKYLRVSCVSMDAHNIDTYYWGSNDRQAYIQAATEPTVLDSIHLDGYGSTRDYEVVNANLQVLSIESSGYLDEESLSKLPLVLPSLQKFAVDLEYAETLISNVTQFAPEIDICDYDGVEHFFEID